LILDKEPPNSRAAENFNESAATRALVRWSGLLLCPSLLGLKDRPAAGYMLKTIGRAARRAPNIRL